MRILVVSDLHLGNGTKSDDFGYGEEGAERERKLMEFINAQNADRVYLNGDIYELWQARWKRVKKAHPKLVEIFENDPKYIYIIGNHDFKLSGLYSDEIRTKSGKRAIIAHGFKADAWMNNALSRFFVWFIGALERLISPNIDAWPHMLRRPGHKSTLKKQQIKYAEKLLQTYDICILGHTHYHDIENYGEGKIYANSGTCQNGKLQGIILDTDEDDVFMVEG